MRGGGWAHVTAGAEGAACPGEASGCPANSGNDDHKLISQCVSPLFPEIGFWSFPGVAVPGLPSTFGSELPPFAAM